MEIEKKRKSDVKEAKLIKHFFIQKFAWKNNVSDGNNFYGKKIIIQPINRSKKKWCKESKIIKKNYIRVQMLYLATRVQILDSGIEREGFVFVFFFGLPCSMVLSAALLDQMPDGTSAGFCRIPFFKFPGLLDKNPVRHADWNPIPGSESGKSNFAGISATTGIRSEICKYWRLGPG